MREKAPITTAATISILEGHVTRDNRQGIKDLAARFEYIDSSRSPQA